MTHIPIHSSRILLKLSGELLASNGNNFDLKSIEQIVSCIQATYSDGIQQIGLVIGGGNLFRGREAQQLHLKLPIADRVGMLATCMNALILKEFLNKSGIPALVMGDFLFHPNIDPYHVDRAKHALNEHTIVIFANGLAQPFFTTDTASVVRAQEIEANVLVKATKVAGIFDKDPCKYKDAKKYTSLTCSKALMENIQVMDDTAFCLLKTSKIPLFVYQFGKPLSLAEALKTPSCGTWVSHNQ